MDLYVVPAAVRHVADTLQNQVDQVAAARPTFSWSDLGAQHVASAFSEANGAGHEARQNIADRLDVLASACDRSADSFENTDAGLAQSARAGSGGSVMRAL